MNSFLPQKEPKLRGKNIIPVCEPDLSGNEERYVLDALHSTWISSSGSYVTKFEKMFARVVSRTRYAVAVNSGTSALHLSLLACGIGKGDEVIVPTFTMIATANAVTYCGAKPIFVDADPISWNIDVSKIEEKITKKTKAIIVVHIYGSPVDMDFVHILANKYNLKVIEDAAEAHGAEYKGKRVGSMGDVAAFSLYANKIVTTGEGGIVTTNDRKISDHVRKLRDHAFGKKRHFWHEEVGYSYNMGNLQGAVGLAQVERFNAFVEKRRAHARLYTKLLQKVPGLILPIEARLTKNVFWMYGILIEKKSFGMDKNALRQLLAKKGIETRSFFIPMDMQPPYYTSYKNPHYPIAERLCKDGLYLPSSGTLTSNTIQYICGQLTKR